MKKISAIVIGAGGRGTEAYPPYALRHPDRLEIVAVAEPDENRRRNLAEQYHIPDEMCFTDYQTALSRDRLADLAMICTSDKLHVQPLRAALQKGYHVLLEKPMSTDIEGCVAIAEAARNSDRIVSICHVLRYTPFFMTLKALLDEGRIGRLISVMHNENVGFWHQAHSFVRGTFRNTDEAAPMILAKCCHDMDILLYLIGKDCKRVSSFGALTYFKPENAPEGAADRCVDCAVAKDCPYNAVQFYTDPKNIDWTFALDCARTPEQILERLKTHRLGRCVFQCDNDVVDHQVVNMEFEDEITVAFTMCAFTRDCSRTIKLMGTHGEIGGNVEKNLITVKDFVSGTEEDIPVPAPQAGHSGGDEGIMHNLIDAIAGIAPDRTSAQISLQSHMMAFAAEKSRLEGCVVDLRDWMAEIDA